MWHWGTAVPEMMIVNIRVCINNMTIEMIITLRLLYKSSVNGGLMKTKILNTNHPETYCIGYTSPTNNENLHPHHSSTMLIYAEDGQS